MMMRSGQWYRCQNQECAADIEVKKDSIDGQSNPRCCCGAEMKKHYAKPVLRTLDKDPAVVADILSSKR